MGSPKHLITSTALSSVQYIHFGHYPHCRCATCWVDGGGLPRNHGLWNYVFAGVGWGGVGDVNVRLTA